MQGALPICNFCDEVSDDLQLCANCNAWFCKEHQALVLIVEEVPNIPMLTYKQHAAKINAFSKKVQNHTGHVQAIIYGKPGVGKTSLLANLLVEDRSRCPGCRKKVSE